MDFLEDLFDFDFLKRKRRQGGSARQDDHGDHQDDDHQAGYSDQHYPQDNSGYPYSQNVQPGGSRVVCPKCTALVSEGARFCQSCGISLAASKCSYCGVTVSGDAGFCPQCGGKLR